MTAHGNGPAGRNGPCDPRDRRAPGRRIMLKRYHAITRRLNSANERQPTHEMAADSRSRAIALHPSIWCARMGTHLGSIDVCNSSVDRRRPEPPRAWGVLGAFPARGLLVGRVDVAMDGTRVRTVVAAGRSARRSGIIPHWNGPTGRTLLGDRKTVVRPAGRSMLIRSSAGNSHGITQTRQVLVGSPSPPT
jgi:hypothetical protein